MRKDPVWPSAHGSVQKVSMMECEFGGRYFRFGTGPSLRTWNEDSPCAGLLVRDPNRRQHPTILGSVGYTWELARITVPQVGEKLLGDP